MIKKIFSNSLIVIIMGILTGIISKYCDGASNEFLFNIGLFTSGLTPWLLVFVFFIYVSNKKSQSIKLVSFFMLPMLALYYLYSYFICGYLFIKIVFFWIVIFLMSILTMNFIWKLRYKKSFKYLFVIASIMCITFDFIFISGASFLILIPEIILAGIAFRYINKMVK